MLKLASYWWWKLPKGEHSENNWHDQNTLEFPYCFIPTNIWSHLQAHKTPQLSPTNIAVPNPFKIIRGWSSHHSEGSGSGGMFSGLVSASIAADKLLMSVCGRSVFSFSPSKAATPSGPTSYKIPIIFTNVYIISIGFIYVLKSKAK